MSIRSLVLAAVLLVSMAEASANPFYVGPVEFPAPGQPSGTNRPAAQVFFPKDYRQDSDQVWPMVMVLHGYAASGILQEAYFGLRPRLSKRGFILVVPNGTIDAKGQPFWNATEFCCDFGKTGQDDSGYLVGLVKELQAKYHVDLDRTYLLGHSNGGFMANRLACDAGHLFAGIVSLAGGSYLNPALCKNQNPISMLQIHGIDDPTIQYEGTADYPSARTTVQRWVDRNHCAGEPVVGEPMNLFFSNPGDETRPESWSGCAGGTEVGFWTMNAYTSSLHKPHIPGPRWEMSEKILDFLFRQRRVH